MHGLGMVHGWKAQKLEKHYILRVFTMPNLITIEGDYRLMKRNRIQVF